MTPPKEISRLIEDAAKAHSKTMYEKHHISRGSIHSFTQGAHFGVSLMQKEVDELVEENAEMIKALEEIKLAGMESVPCPDGIDGCGVSHRKLNKQARIAYDALRKHRARMEGKE